MNRLLLVLLLGGIAAAGLWWLLAEDTDPDGDVEPGTELPGALGGLGRRAAPETMRAEGPRPVAPDSGPVDPQAMAVFHTVRVALHKKDGGFRGEDVLAVLRSHMRVRFRPKEAEARFLRLFIETEEEFPSDGIMGVDVVRLMTDAGYLVDDRRGIMEISEVR